MTSRQYIKVKASGTSNPDPAVYCPANGYYDPSAPLEYIPDPNIPEVTPATGEIILICTTALDAAINVATSVSSGLVNYDVYGDSDTLIDTFTLSSGTTFFYQFPASGGIVLESGLEAFKVVITPDSTTITSFGVKTKTNWAPLGWPIVEAHIKCPDITSLYRAFLDQKYIQLIKFYGDADSLVTLYEFAENTKNLKKAILPTSLDALSTLSQTFNLSGVEEIQIPTTTLPALQNLEYAFSNSSIKTNPIEHIASLPSLTSAQGAFSNTEKLKINLIIPEAQSCANITYIAQYSSITKLTFQGAMNGVITSSGIQRIIGETENCEEVVMPTTMTGVYDFIYTWFNAYALKRIVMPTTVVLSSQNEYGGGWFSNCPLLEEITEATVFTVSNYGFSPGSLAVARNLTEFKQRDLAPRFLVMNGTSSYPGNLTSVDIDYSNMDGSYLRLSYQNLDATELERISGLLPTVASGDFECGGNPGYATFDRTIAENKGWTIAY